MKIKFLQRTFDSARGKSDLVKKRNAAMARAEEEARKLHQEQEALLSMQYTTAIISIQTELTSVKQEEKIIHERIYKVSILSRIIQRIHDGKDVGFLVKKILKNNDKEIYIGFMGCRPLHLAIMAKQIGNAELIINLLQHANDLSLSEARSLRFNEAYADIEPMYYLQNNYEFFADKGLMIYHLANSLQHKLATDIHFALTPKTICFEQITMEGIFAEIGTKILAVTNFLHNKLRVTESYKIQKIKYLATLEHEHQQDLAALKDNIAQSLIEQKQNIMLKYYHAKSKSEDKLIQGIWLTAAGAIVSSGLSMMVSKWQLSTQLANSLTSTNLFSANSAAFVSNALVDTGVKFGGGLITGQVRIDHFGKDLLLTGATSLLGGQITAFGNSELFQDLIPTAGRKHIINALNSGASQALHTRGNMGREFFLGAISSGIGSRLGDSTNKLVGDISSGMLDATLHGNNHRAIWSAGAKGLFKKVSGDFADYAWQDEVNLKNNTVISELLMDDIANEATMLPNFESGKGAYNGDFVIEGFSNPIDERVRIEINPGMKQMPSQRATSLLGQGIEFLIGAAYASEMHGVNPRLPIVNGKRLGSDSLQVGKFKQGLIGVGHSVVLLYQGGKQLVLMAGEKGGWFAKGAVARYTLEVNREMQIYQNTPVAQSTTARVSQGITDVVSYTLLPGGLGMRGAGLIFSSIASGSAIGGLRFVEDSNTSSRLSNAFVGGIEGAAGGYIAGKVIKSAEPMVKIVRKNVNRQLTVHFDGYRISKSLGANPFRGKSFVQIDRRLRGRGFNTVGKAPMNGEGAYFHPTSDRKYFFDYANGKKAVKGNQRETTHIDLHRMLNGSNLGSIKKVPVDFKFKNVKRKYPLGEKLYVNKNNKP